MMSKFWTRIIFVIFFAITCWLQRRFFGEYEIGKEFLNNLIVFISIVFGFCATSLSIFATSRYVSHLYDLEDSADENKTLLHALVGKFQRGLTVALFTVIYLLTILFAQQNSLLVPESLSNNFLLPLLSIILLNFYYAYSMLDVIGKVVIQESKEKQ